MKKIKKLSKSFPEGQEPLFPALRSLKCPEKRLKCPAPPSSATLFVSLFLRLPASSLSSNVQRTFSFFASQTLHNINFFKKKNPAKQKTAQFFPFFFCFTRELNPYSPLTYTLTSARELKPFTPPLPSPSAHPSAHTFTLHPWRQDLR